MAKLSQKNNIVTVYGETFIFQKSKSKNFVIIALPEASYKKGIGTYVKRNVTISNKKIQNTNLLQNYQNSFII